MFNGSGAGVAAIGLPWAPSCSNPPWSDPMAFFRFFTVELSMVHSRVRPSTLRNDVKGGDSWRRRAQGCRHRSPFNRSDFRAALAKGRAPVNRGDAIFTLLSAGHRRLWRFCPGGRRDTQCAAGVAAAQRTITIAKKCQS